MPAFNLKRDKSYRCFVIFFLLFIFSTAVFAQDSSSIASLRQIGKAFAGIAEKASPAVVGITAKKTITKNYPVIQEWPFGRPFDPFEDDFFTHQNASISKPLRAPGSLSPKTATYSRTIILSARQTKLQSSLLITGNIKQNLSVRTPNLKLPL